MEKAYKNKIDLEMLFIDFKQAFDRIKTVAGPKKKLGISKTLRRVVTMTI